MPGTYRGGERCVHVYSVMILHDECALPRVLIKHRLDGGSEIFSSDSLAARLLYTRAHVSCFYDNTRPVYDIFHHTHIYIYMCVLGAHIIPRARAQDERGKTIARLQCCILCCGGEEVAEKSSATSVFAPPPPPPSRVQHDTPVLRLIGYYARATTCRFVIAFGSQTETEKVCTNEIRVCTINIHVSW